MSLGLGFDFLPSAELVLFSLFICLSFKLFGTKYTLIPFHSVML